MSVAFALKILRNAVVIPVSASVAVGSLTGTTTPLVAPRARTVCARSAAETPQGDTPRLVSAEVQAGTAVAISAVVPTAASISITEASSGGPALGVPHLPPAPPTEIMTGADSIKVPKRELDRPLGQVLDIVRFYGGDVLSVGRGDPIPAREAGSRAAIVSVPSSPETPGGMVIEVPRDRLECALAELRSNAQGKLARYGVCPRELSKEVVDLEGRLHNKHATEQIRLRLMPEGEAEGDAIVATHGLGQVQRGIQEIAVPQHEGSGEKPVVVLAPCGGESRSR